VLDRKVGKYEKEPDNELYAGNIMQFRFRLSGASVAAAFDTSSFTEDFNIPYYTYIEDLPDAVIKGSNVAILQTHPNVPTPSFLIKTPNSREWLGMPSYLPADTTQDPFRITGGVVGDGYWVNDPLILLF
jgi:hypothetical protein